MKITEKNNEPIFKKIFGEQWDNLPPVMLKHYSLRPYSEDMVTIKGKMHIDYSLIFTLFLPLLRIANILVPYKGKDIPTTVYLKSKVDSNAFYFYRNLFFPGKKPYSFCSQATHLKDNEIIEYVRFAIGLHMRCYYNSKQVIWEHIRYVWKLFGCAIPLPITFIVGKVYVDKYALTDNTFALHMKIQHPLWGTLYTYEGAFILE